MLTLKELAKINIDKKSHGLLQQLFNENPRLKEILEASNNTDDFLKAVKNWVLKYLENHAVAADYYQKEKTGRDDLEQLAWPDLAAIRLLDYVDSAGKQIEDLNRRGEIIELNPLGILWLAAKKGTGGGKPDFFTDMIHLLRQFSGAAKPTLPTAETVVEWMKRYPDGLDPRMVELREENRERVLNVIIDRIDRGEINSEKYAFASELSREQKMEKSLEWWDDRTFHLRFAARTADFLNELLGNSLDPETMGILHDAEKAGIPFFVNPYYVSLLNVRTPDFAQGADLAIRDYVIYSRQLVEEFGSIAAWEKEDIVEPGKPNAAGWLLPSHNIHRRYPDVAILIPETAGRACGGLCASCQRMYGFQDGNLNFDLDKLKAKTSWKDKLADLMTYFEKDSQLRDILITGGDALMSSDKSLKQILDAVYYCAEQKIKANQQRAEGEKYAELLRVRLGTRLPVYLPQRITPKLLEILADFKARASTIGVKQFVIQTHFESPLEITVEAQKAVKDLVSAGWTVTNQLVFTASASRRGHTAKLRKSLNDIGVLTYYTFSVKGFMENYHGFATNERAMQEQVEEKVIGLVPEKFYDDVRQFPIQAEDMVENIDKLRKEAGIPFLATDRNVLNLPGIGKSLTYRVIGVTYDGRRILEFDHDATRKHSPILEKMGRIYIIESKSIQQYLNQMEEMGEDVEEYLDVFGYSIGETEPRMPIYEYPEYEFKITDEVTNLDISDSWK
jgi:lysine 2,3-aminomutase